MSATLYSGMIEAKDPLRICWQDLDKEDRIPEPFRQASANEVHAASVQESRARKHSDKVRQSKLQQLGFEVEHTGEILL